MLEPRHLHVVFLFADSTDFGDLGGWMDNSFFVYAYLIRYISSAFVLVNLQFDGRASQAFVSHISSALQHYSHTHTIFCDAIVSEHGRRVVADVCITESRHCRAIRPPCWLQPDLGR